ncbi:MAG: hypothetical protein JWL89_118 [Candidatus Saccharibacteria bacterium]|jgi:hypothetical protein|nr:hypothetical protein [Candidatus Saccharibacteria bacterium]
MKKPKKLRPVRRTTAVLLACMLIVGGVAFAALISLQNKVTGNTIETATANIQISRDSGTTYASTVNGFDFPNLYPGGPAYPSGNGYFILIKNTGTVPLGLKFGVSSSPTNLSGIDLSKVNVTVVFMGLDGLFTVNPSQTFNLAELVSANTSGGVTLNLPTPLTVGGYQRFGIQVSLAADAVVGSNASIGNIDFAFAGVTPGIGS